MLSSKQASIFLFLEGFASIAIQFLILRQLSPFVGSSVIVVSIVISIFLAALAGGYYSGGKVAENHTGKLSRNLFLAATILGIFGSYSFVLLFFNLFSGAGTLFAFIVYLLLVMAPSVFFVAQTIPILANSMQHGSVGEKTGNTLLFSTIGNVFGGVITTVIIMYYFGISWALVFTSMILYALSITLSSRKRRVSFYLMFLVPLVFSVNISMSETFFVKETAYANYGVIEDVNHTYFIANESGASMLSKESGKGFPYIENIKEMIAHYKKRGSLPDILVLGAGGFALTAEVGAPIGNVTYVDIDTQIRRTAEKYFLKKKIVGNFVGKDARVFLREDASLYDFIIVDAYTNKTTIPESLTTLEFYKSVRTHLKPEGHMISNIILDPFLRDSFSVRLDNTIRLAFHTCYTQVIFSKGGGTNSLYLCKEGSSGKKNDQSFYSDSHNRATVDNFISHFTRDK